MKAVPNKAQTLVTLIFVFLAPVIIQAQSPGQRPSPTPPPRPIEEMKDKDERPLTTFEEEIRAKRAIKLAEKDHQENLNRAREIGQIGKELQETFKNKSTLDRTTLKKVERLEKLTKKIRGEAGGGDEEVTIINRPSDIPSAVNQIAETADLLSKDVRDTPRQVVSASVIANANVLLELIKVLRGFAPKL